METWKQVSFYAYRDERTRSDCLGYAREDCARFRRDNPAGTYRWVHRESSAGYSVEVAQLEESAS